MTSHAATLAQQWSDLCDGDVDAMVRKIYAPNLIVDHASHGHRSLLVGRNELMAAERQLLAMIPGHRNEIVRVLDGGDRRAVIAMATPMYALDTVAERLGEGESAVLRGRDVREGVAAFLEHRRPVFTGK